MLPQLHAISWNLTRRCNLRCGHCYLDADLLDGRRVDELSTDECRRVIDQIREVNQSPFLILTGGEPLLRPDLPDIAEYASSLGAYVVVGTNGLLLTDAVVVRLREAGVKGLGVSLDAASPPVHDSLRGMPGAWERAVAGIKQAAAQGMPFAVQTTVTRENAGDLDRIAELAESLGATALNVYFLVCTGRGQEMSDLTPGEYERVLGRLYDLHGRFGGRMLVTAKCAPHFRRVVFDRDPASPLMKTYQGGCPAGTHYIRITPAGDVTPCPYMPESVGNIRRTQFRVMWESSPTFASLRQPDLRERCDLCEFRTVCGGCRARALAETGNMLGTDPWCAYEPGRRRIEDVVLPREETLGQPVMRSLEWSADAIERLERVPSFARGMVAASVERYAAEHGRDVVTAELMAEVKTRLIGDGKGMPAFLRAAREAREE